jgi:hypothetical protein
LEFKFLLWEQMCLVDNKLRGNTEANEKQDQMY